MPKVVGVVVAVVVVTAVLSDGGAVVVIVFKGFSVSGSDGGCDECSCTRFILSSA